MRGFSVALAALLAACNLPAPLGEAPGSSPDFPGPAGTAAPTSGGIAGEVSGDVVDPGDVEYLGAFRLPQAGKRPRTFEYGGNAMTLNPSGDAGGPDDGFPGSLFITGYDRMPYGDLPDGGQVAEVSIPAPIVSDDVEALNRAEFVQEFRNVLSGRFARMEEIPRIGLLFLDAPASGPVIHVAYGQHLEPDPPAATHGWFSPDLALPVFEGEWFLDGASFYNTTDYMLEIHDDWAEAYVQGAVIGTGRFRDGGWSGMGPALFAYRPWDEKGDPYPSGARIRAVPLLLYGASSESDRYERCFNGYQHPDEWNGGAWLTTPSGRTALLFAGTKATGEKSWYGYVNPDGPEFPCVDEDIADFLTCRLADGSPCPAEDFRECAGHSDYRGWWTTRWDAQFLLYNPAELARVARGELAPWEPQPYASIDIDEYLFHNPAGVETGLLGEGPQRRYRVGDVAYDRAHGLLYVLELFADGAAPVVHVWRIR